MRKTTAFRRGMALLLALCTALSLALCCAGCGGAGAGTGGTGGMGASAASMFLRKTEGAVAVADSEGQSVEPAENLGLYSGYAVNTEAASYAWIDLDNVKLAKLDESSAAAITKDGKNLSIDVASGGMFFNVTEPLAEDETMEIRTSSMLVGIRGTCGWVAQNRVCLLEGTVSVAAGENTVTVNAGEMAYLRQDGTMQVMALSFESIPDFVARELLDDDALQQAVSEASGLYIPTTYEELLSALEKRLLTGEIVFREEIDFEQDGSPEFLVISLQDAGGDHEDYANEGHFPYRRIQFGIYRNGPEGIRYLTGTLPMISRGMTAQTCSLVERDGRLFLKCTGESGTLVRSEQYFGSVAERDGGAGDWGEVDYFAGGHASLHDERGFIVSHNDREQGNAGQDQYAPVRELCRADGLDQA